MQLNNKYSLNQPVKLIKDSETIDCVVSKIYIEIDALKYVIHYELSVGGIVIRKRVPENKIIA